MKRYNAEHKLEEEEKIKDSGDSLCLIARPGVKKG